MGKLLLDESKATLIEEDAIVEFEEPEEPSDEVKNNAIASVINDSIKDEFSLIDKINGALSTIEAEHPDKEEDITAILKTISDEKSVQIGMLTKVLEIINSKNSDMMQAGIEKAEEIISEPASTDLNKEE